MMRIILFLATNIAIVTVLGLVLELLGLRQALEQQGTGIDVTALLITAAIVGMSGSFISLAMSKWMALRSVGAKVITAPANQTETWLVQTVRRQAEAAGIGMPDIAVYQANDMNAFATGMNRNKALVAVSTGLLRNMNSEQVEAVLGHEISHVANGDMVTLSLIQGVVNTFVFFLSRVIGHVVDRVVFKVERGHGPAYWFTVMVGQLVLGILASAIVMWFSRYREFRADAGSARLAGPNKMISALEQLQRGSRNPHLPDQLEAMGISGGMRSGLARWFMSHPPIEERIRALRHAPS